MRMLFIVLAALLACPSVLADELLVCGAAPWIESSSIKAFSPEVSSHLKSVLFKESGLADIGEAYNPTDVLDGNPRNGVVLAGSNANCIILAVESGGIASWHEGFAYRQKSGHWVMFKRFEVNGRPKSLPDLVRALYTLPRAGTR
ncbi:MAG: hypothetical protein K0S46_1885 [Moraxellaceae bacterium]|jgi:hypothetical protein|nr:hypothetical protein [Moraxellaceae bacterium]